jgi:hypothetical protein
MKRVQNVERLLLPALLALACTGTAHADGWFSSLFGDKPTETAPAVDPDPRPSWIDNPGEGASASAGMHVKGRAAQEELATQRAREEFAKRYGVSVESEQAFSTSVANNRSSTVAEHVAHEQTKQSDVKAVVKAKWRDPDSDVLWVWVVPSN